MSAEPQPTQDCRDGAVPSSQLVSTAPDRLDTAVNRSGCLAASIVAP